MKYQKALILLLVGFGLTAATASAQAINVTPTGVGIGTTTPTQKLDVVGNITATGKLMATDEVVSNTSTAVGQFRAVSGPYGAIIRNDGSDTYILLTAPNDQYGTWTNKRPIRINNATGAVFVNGVEANPPHVTRIQVAGAVDDDLAICVGGTPFVYTGTSSQAVNYDIKFNESTCMWYAYTNNRNNGYRGDGLRAGVGYIFAGSERLTFTPVNYSGGYSSNLTYTVTYSDGTVATKNINGWYEAQLCNKVFYYADNENNSGYNYRNRVIGVVP